MKNEISNGIRNTPFLRIVVPMIAGIVAARHFVVPWGVLTAVLVATWALAWIGYKRREAWWYVTVAIGLTAMLLGQMHRTSDPLPKGQRLLITFQVAEVPSGGGRWMKTSAEVGYYRYENDRRARWRNANTKILLWVDTCYRVEQGGQYAAVAYVNPVDTTDSGYGKLMRSRGYSGKVFITPGHLLARSPYQSATPVYYARRFQQMAAERLSRLDLSEDSRAVISAMVVGDKREMGAPLKNAYSLVGASHLLAVSGLHVGIVFTLVNLLLYLLPVMSKGHVAKNLLAILAIWGYAIIAGLSPSVIRAACMFSGLQIALAVSVYRNPVNTMLATAAVMLAIEPNYLFDISFQLSFLAVLAIFVAFGPAYDRLKREKRYKSLNPLISVVIVGVVATMGTAPLVVYQFGKFPLVGMLINPVVILTANFIVLLSVFWMIFPFAALAGVIGPALEFFARAQNRVVEWCADLSWASFGVKIPWGLVVLYYTAYILVAVWWYGQSDKKRIVRHEDF